MAIIKIKNPAIDLDAAEIPNLPASKITSGTFADARIAASNVSQHATSFDDNKLVNDISTLALRQASDQNKSAYNTNSSSVDVFQDDTGIDTTTNVSRNASEYVSSISNTTATADSGGTLTDITASNTYYSSATTNDNYGDGNDIGIDGSSNYSFWSTSALLTGDFRVETNGTSTTESTYTTGSNANRFEFGITSLQGSTSDGDSNLINQRNSNLTDHTNISHTNTAPYIYLSTGGYGQTIMIKKNTSGGARQVIATITDSWSSTSQLSFARVDSTLYFMIDGVIKHTFESSDFNTSANLYYILGFRTNPSNWLNCKYRSEMTTVKGTTTSTTNATGNFTGTTITAPSSVSSMGAIITYQDQAGTNALNTDIVLKLSADNGSNYSTATLTAMPDFSSGIKMAKVNDLSVTAGTQLKYKIEFANQASGTKEARIRGVSLQY